MNFEELLRKYIALVIEYEGTDFIDQVNLGYHEKLRFTDNEIKKLRELSEQARQIIQV